MQAESLWGPANQFTVKPNPYQFQEIGSYNTDAAAGDYMGQSVAIADQADIVAIGSPGVTVGTTANSGKVVLYDYNRTTRQLLNPLLVTPGTSERIGSGYGHSVALDNLAETLVVGAPTKGSIGNVYVFRKVNGVYTFNQKIRSKFPAGSGWFGVGCAISGDGKYLYISCRNESGSFNFGFVHTYKYDILASLYNYVGRFAQGAGSANDFLGQKLATNQDGSIVVAGCPGRDTSGSDAGAVYILSRSGDALSQQNVIYSSPAVADAMFGYGVGLNSAGTLMVVGAAAETYNGSFLSAGRAYTFRKNGQNWVQENTIQPASPQSHGKFGSDIALSGDGNLLLIGEPSRSTNGTNSGRVVIFGK